MRCIVGFKMSKETLRFPPLNLLQTVPKFKVILVRFLNSNNVLAVANSFVLKIGIFNYKLDLFFLLL